MAAAHRGQSRAILRARRYADSAALRVAAAIRTDLPSSPRQCGRGGGRECPHRTGVEGRQKVRVTAMC